MEKKHYTIKDIEKIMKKRRVIRAKQENDWTMLVLDSGVRVKVRSF